MKGEIIVSGIQTNNLKNITVSIKKNALNLILGPSGSGKSSLAYDTVAQIGLHELGAMYYDSANEPEYKVNSYSNMVVTVPIKQLNNNNNVRSTVGTYFSISPCLAKIYSSLLRMPYDYFVLNKAENICPSCLGVGYLKTLDPCKVVDYDKTIEEVPIRCWKRNKDFYRQILQLFCADMKIPSQTKFRLLSDKQQQTILYGISESNGFDISIAEGKLNLILGASGVGKSTLLREYFPQVFDEYLYISQKPLAGNIRSTVATAINVIKISAKVNTSYQMKVGGISFMKQIQKRARKLKKGVDK